MNTAPPGWYPDPQDPTALRWFNGESWTDQQAPATPALHAAAATGPAGQPWQGAPAWQGAQPQYAGQAPAPGRNSLKIALLVIGGVVGLVVVIGIIAAIAIPVFLNQRNKASVAEVSSLTCAEASATAVALSGKGALADNVFLTGMTDTALVSDGRATLKVPQPGSDAFVMDCRGTATWSDGLSSVETLEVRMNSDRALVYSFLAKE